MDGFLFMSHVRADVSLSVIFLAIENDAWNKQTEVE